MDDIAETYRTSVLPRLDDVPGFCSVSAMGDRQTGMSVLTATYDDRDSMDRARDMIRAMREEFIQRMGMEVVEVGEFDLAIHHLRVPEMA